MDTIRGVKGDARTLALTNYYEHTAKKIDQDCVFYVDGILAAKMIFDTLGST